MAEEKLEEFTVALQTSFLNSKTKAEADLMPDIEVTPQMLTFELINSLKKLEPFGKDNPQPLFYLSDIKLPDAQVLAGKHLKWDLGQDLEIIYWNGFDKVPDMVGNPKIAAHFNENTYLGRWRRQLIVQGISFS